MLKPYDTKNIIFIDTEFSDLDPYKGELLSVGIVKLNGEEFYIELEQPEEMSTWVKKHVMKLLDGPKLSRKEAMYQIKEFVGTSLPYAVGFVDNYDVIYLTKLFGAGKLPFKWMTIDFASVLFAAGINPVKFQQDSSGARSFYKKLGIDTKKYRHHYALDDARILREVWLKLVEQ